VRDGFSGFQVLERNQDVVAGVEFENALHGQGKILNDAGPQEVQFLIVKAEDFRSRKLGFPGAKADCLVGFESYLVRGNRQNLCAVEPRIESRTSLE
jgi:hypothetical protein